MLFERETTFFSERDVHSHRRIEMNGQDAFALRRQQRAVAALARGFFTQEIVPVTITDRRGVKTIVDTDEHLRSDGMVTAGNAPGVNDGVSIMEQRR